MSAGPERVTVRYGAVQCCVRAKERWDMEYGMGRQRGCQLVGGLAGVRDNMTG